MIDVQVATKYLLHELTIEELTANSRPEAIQLMRKIEGMIEDAYDIGLVDGIKSNDEQLTEFTKSIGCVFKDIDACGTDCCKVSV